jgi:diaminohydroxyphosphoribosylaminopyrimidine deaminase/5-amino-6-(5-phosphoribosylamino)uracil reductase
MSHSEYMKLALGLAARAMGCTSPNPMVGAVVVRNDRIVGRGYHHSAGEPHAEVNAIDEAGSLAENATLYVTLEPCNHFGRTPPCTRKILDAGIKTVVVAMDDPNPDVKGGGVKTLRENGVEVIEGVCEAEARRLNEFFITYVKTHKPFVILKCAATLDGQIATRTGDSKWVTGESARMRVHEIRQAVDAIMVGIGTVNHDDPSLTTRLEEGRGRDPIRVILDTRLSISPDARLLHQPSNADTIIVAGDNSEGAGHQKRRRAIKETGATILPVPLKQGKIDLEALMTKLGEMEITSLLIEGGAQVIASSFAAGIVDKVMLFYAPKLLGGSDGVPICSGEGAGLMKDCIMLQNAGMERFGEDFLIEGYVKKSSS